MYRVLNVVRPSIRSNHFFLAGNAPPPEIIAGFEGRKNSVRKEEMAKDAASRRGKGLQTMLKGAACMNKLLKDCPWSVGQLGLKSETLVATLGR